MTDEPDGWVETTEWSLHLVGELGVLGREHTFPPLGESLARARLDWWRSFRTDVKSELVCRTVITKRGGWRPAEEGDDRDGVATATADGGAAGQPDVPRVGP